MGTMACPIILILIFMIMPPPSDMSMGEMIVVDSIRVVDTTRVVATTNRIGEEVITLVVTEGVK